VWLQLEAKRIPYRVVKINMRAYGPKPPEYMARVPSGLLPALELDGVLYTESAVIADVLEASFPDDTPLVPSPDDAPASARHGALRPFCFIFF
jgi:glutathione S-transferase